MKTNIGSYELWVNEECIYSGTYVKCLYFEKLYKLQNPKNKTIIYKIIYTFKRIVPIQDDLSFYYYISQLFSS